MTHSDALQRPSPGGLARLIFGSIWSALKNLKTALLVFGLVLSLALNVATLTIESVFSMLSTAIETTAKALPLSWTTNPKTGKPKTFTVRQKQKKVVSALGSRLSALQARIGKPTRRTARLVGPITKRLRTRVARGAARSLATATGEAIPLAGIAVIVAATSWELYDACESSKDLAELDRTLGIADDGPSNASQVCGLTPPTKEELWQKIKASPGQAWEAAANALKKDKTDSPAKDHMFHLPSWEHVMQQSKKQYRNLLDWVWKTLGR